MYVVDRPGMAQVKPLSDDGAALAEITDDVAATRTAAAMAKFVFSLMRLSVERLYICSQKKWNEMV